MFRLLAILVTFVGILAVTPSHLKPGALIDKLGEVYLTEEVLIVRYPNTPLINTSLSIKVIFETLHSLANSLNATKDREDKAPTHIHSHDLTHSLADRVVYLKVKIEQAATNFILHPIHSRSKRGLLDVVGKASKFLFGTAIEDDIRVLREHYNQVLSFAAKNRI